MDGPPFSDLNSISCQTLQFNFAAHGPSRHFGKKNERHVNVVKHRLIGQLQFVVGIIGGGRNILDMFKYSDLFIVKLVMLCDVCKFHLYI